MADGGLARLEVRAPGDPRRAEISIEGVEQRHISKLELVLDVSGEAFFRVTYPFPMVTISANEMPGAFVYRAQLVTTLGVDRAVEGLTAEAYTIEDALAGLLERVKAVRANADTQDGGSPDA